MRHWTPSAAIGFTLLIASSSAASPAQDVISGSYVLDEKRSDNAFKAIDSALVSFANTKLPAARSLLRKTISGSGFRISRAGSRLSVVYDPGRPIVVLIKGEPIKWKLIDELVFDVSAQSDGEAVSLTFRGDHSEHTIVYRLDGEQLVAETTMISPLLSKPVAFKRVYNRANRRG